ncbi:hypothetical protein MMAN_17640 [Mycobacterium mantenii]|uniref:Uncharacterized protein n=1 Tax=Mycobacterium mantenii TaxID=560555 RepID=A0ABM7JQ51_MYCNT|nr:hypothetical protein MMAN_17640 [Mycobacterium mantenii]
MVHCAVGISLVSPTNWPQLPQPCGTAADGGFGPGVCPAPGSGVAAAVGNVTAQGPLSSSPNENSAELRDLRRDMAVIVAGPGTRYSAKWLRLGLGCRPRRACDDGEESAKTSL